MSALHLACACEKEIEVLGRKSRPAVGDHWAARLRLGANDTMGPHTLWVFDSIGFACGIASLTDTRSRLYLATVFVADRSAYGMQSNDLASLVLPLVFAAVFSLETIA